MGERERDTTVRLATTAGGRIELWFNDWDEAVDYANQLNAVTEGMRQAPQFWVDTRPGGPDLLA